MQTPTKAMNPSALAAEAPSPGSNPGMMSPPPEAKPAGSVLADLFEGVKSTAGKIAERYIPPEAIIAAIERGEAAIETAVSRLSPDQHAQFVSTLERILAVVKRGGPGGRGAGRGSRSRRASRVSRASRRRHLSKRR
jgi:hypothetical protein